MQDALARSNRAISLQKTYGSLCRSGKSLRVDEGESELTALCRYLRQLEEEFSKSAGSVRRGNISQHRLHEETAGAADSLSPPNPSAFLLDDQTSNRWREVQTGEYNQQAFQEHLCWVLRRKDWTAGYLQAIETIRISNKMAIDRASRAIH